MLPRTPYQPQMLWRTPKGFAASHCMNCKAGWVRTGPENGVSIVCLIDREPVPDAMTSCNRFEAVGTPEPV